MARTPLILVGLGLLLAGAVVHGLWTDRWRPSGELARASGRLAALPDDVEEWKGKPYEQDAEALVRLLSGGRLNLSARGSFDQALRSRGDLRDAFLGVVLAPCPSLEGVLPEELFRNAVREHLAGRDRGGLLQGLYSIKAFLLRPTAGPVEPAQEVLRV
jgi:hypothetical protein